MPKKGSKLSQNDIQELLQNPSDDVRADVARKVAQQIDTTSLTEEERELANSILRTLVKDAAELVRKSLSESLRYADDVPRDVALALAKDIDSVAVPLLESSPVFTDDDLIEIVNSGRGSKQIAIAGRPQVSDKVAVALVETDNGEAVAKLVSNDGATISETTYSELLDRHGKFEDVQESLANRSELPITVAERLVTMVSGKLQTYLVERHALSDAQANRIAQDSRERATVDLVELAAQAEDVSKLAQQLKQNGRLTASLMLRALCTGDMRFFEAGMAEMCGVSAEKAGLMIHDAGSLGLQAVFQKTGISEVYFPAFRIAVDVFKETDYDGGDRDRERFRDRMIERILTQYDNIDADDIDYLIDALGRSVDQNQAA